MFSFIFKGQRVSPIATDFETRWSDSRPTAVQHLTALRRFPLSDFVFIRHGLFSWYMPVSLSVHIDEINKTKAARVVEGLRSGVLFLVGYQ